MKHAITFVFFILMVIFSFAQSTPFKGQLIYNNGVLKNYSVIIDGRPATSDFSGIFTTPVPSGVSQVRIQPSDKKYIILYPSGGRVLVPKDNALVTEIVVGNFQSNKYLNDYLSVSSQIKNASNKTATEMRELQNKLDSISRILMQLNYTNEDLMSARERKDGIDLFYPRIDSDLKTFLKQSHKLKNAFQYTADFAFDNSKALVDLIDAVNSFNPAIENFYTNQSMYSRKIADYWQDTALKITYDNISDTIIQSITKKTIASLNDIKSRLNLYFQNRLPGDKSENKRALQKEISLVLPVFNKQLDDVEQCIETFLDQLAAK